MNGMIPQEGEENGGKKTQYVSSYDVGWTAVWASCLPMTFTGVWDTFTCPTESVFRFVNLLPNQLQNWHSVTASPKECCREDTVISLEAVPSYSSNTLQVPLCCSHISALHHTPLSWRVPLRPCTALCKHQQLSPGWRKIGCWLLNYTVQERNVMGYLNILNTQEI